MAETLFEELKRYVGFGPQDEAALQSLAPVASPHFLRIADIFYQRILEHEGSRKALEGGESQVGRLKITLVAWLEKLLNGPWDEAYYQLRCRIGRVHVRIGLPQHYMLGAMSVVRTEMGDVIRQHYLSRPEEHRRTQIAVEKILDLELAIMLHTYREDLQAEHAKTERLATFGQLVGSIGHELRNPLGVIETSLFILKGRIAGDERVHKHFERIGDQISIANHIITNLLDMLRDRPLQKEEVVLEQVLMSAISAVKPPAGVQISVEGMGELPSVLGDNGQLRQVFRNLVENAVQAAAPQGHVRIVGSVQDGKISVVIEDNGPGVHDSIRRRLFEPLITTKGQGIGLGLSLVKRIVERHEGSIHYEPVVVRGARFVLRLPLNA